VRVGQRAVSGLSCCYRAIVTFLSIIVIILIAVLVLSMGLE